MPTYLLRVEGVNLRSVIWDTDDLSTRRGGGLMLLDAVTQLPEQLSALNLHPVATGASIGLFTFDADTPEAVDQVREAVEGHFQRGTFEYPDQSEGGTGHLPLKHGTFVVDVRELGETPIGQYEAVQDAIAANHWRQMQQPSLSLDGLWNTGARDACILDWVRPGVMPSKKAERERELVSASVSDRRRYGVGARQGFYDHELDTRTNYAFTDSVQDLGTADGPRPEAASETTDRKLAVFYADGNKFGQKGMKRLRNEGLTAFGKWSDAIKAHHQKLLGELLERADRGEGWKTSQGAIRLETLLWGGDEIIWVVPAWKGWELAQWFLSQKHEADGKPLSYGCGLVFCHLKAPIQNIVDLAQKIADRAKAAGGDANKSCLAYEVLESFDDVTGDLKRHRVKWLPKAEQERLLAPGNTDPDPLVLDAAHFCDAWAALREIAASDEFPLRQLYMRVHAWRKDDAAEVARTTERLNECKVAGHLGNVVTELGADVGYLHLLQMLPYLPSEVTP
ncbi:MAG: hypothetical protein J0I06_12505 [Planctomycetes bacterium]|nr:hypothetical protein [Planctomycetota bacterium]